MTEHYSSSTVSVSHFCKTCQKHTQHEVNNHRLGSCLECKARLDREYEFKKSLPAPVSGAQRSLWGEVL
jgi:ribosomal protein L44E